MAREASIKQIGVSLDEQAAHHPGDSVSRAGSPLRLRFYLIFAICVAWALCSVAPIWKYLSQPKAAITTLVSLLSIAIGMYWLDRQNRHRRQISWRWFLFLYLVLVTAFAVLYPISLKHTINHGSDREDALRLELTAIHHHQYPYDVRTFLGNPPTPLPGAVLLAAPFFAIGHIAWQNLLWLALFFCFGVHFFRYRATALLFFAVFLLFCPSNFSDLISGGDYLTNFFYIAIAIALFVDSLDRSLYCSIPAAAFVGVALSSRSIYAVILIPLFILTFRRKRKILALALLGVVLTVAAVITLPVFAPHPVTRILQQISQVSGKLSDLPGILHPQWTLPLLGFAATCISFFIKIDIRRLFLIFAISGFVMLAPAIGARALHMRKLPYECAYLSLSVLPFSLWALSKYERTP